MQERYRMRGGSLAVAMLAVVVLGCYADGEKPAATRGNQQKSLGSQGPVDAGAEADDRAQRASASTEEGRSSSAVSLPDGAGMAGASGSSETGVCMSPAVTSRAEAMLRSCAVSWLEVGPLDDVCRFEVRAAEGAPSPLDPDLLSVYFEIADGMLEDIAIVGTLERCPVYPTKGGWVYAELEPLQLQLCPCNCAHVKATEGEIRVRYGCRPIVYV